MYTFYIIINFSARFFVGLMALFPVSELPVSDVRTVTCYQGRKQINIKKEYVDSFSIDRLKMQRIQMAHENDTTYLLYSINYKYNSQKNIVSRRLCYPDHSVSEIKYTYNDSDHSVTLLDSSMGTWQPSEKYFLTEYKDTCQYLHYNNSKPNSGWKKEFTYVNHRVDSYHFYVLSEAMNQSSWKLNATVKYFYSLRSSPDSILRYDNNGAFSGKDVFGYDGAGRLSSVRLYNSKYCFSACYYKYDKPGHITKKKIIATGHDKKQVANSTKYKYNKQGFLKSELYRKHGFWHTWNSYAYTYY